jgi:NodT family efflux transporter outer membrane factor (OMF) lipoprotein
MRAHLTPVALAVAAALLAGCAAPPLPPGPQALAPESFHALPPANAGAAQMTAAFADSAPLQRLVDEVLANNRDLRAAAARVREAEALSSSAATDRLPKADANVGAQRQRAYNSVGSIVTGNGYSLGTSAHWEADLWGRWQSKAQAAAAEAQASALDRDAAALSLTGAALTLQADLIGLGHRLKLAQDTLKVQTQLLDIVKARVNAGRGTALDVARAEALVAGTASSVPALRNAACLTRLRLDVLRGQAPADCDKVSDPLPAMPEPRLISLGTLPNPAALLAQRPDVQAAFSRAKSAAARANQAWAERWPALALNGNIGWSAARTDDLFKNGSLIGALGAGLSWQWLDWGARKADADAARAGYDAAVANAEQAQLLALEDAQAALDTLRDTEQQAVAQAAAAEATTRARDLALKRFDAGVSDFFSLLDAERERLAAQDRLIQLQASRATALVAVHKAFAAKLTAP